MIDIDTAFKKRFTADDLKAAHKHIFEDIFEWAGEFRTVPVYKTEVVIPGLSLQYSEAKNIERDLNIALEELNNTNWEGKTLEQISREFTIKIAKVWRVHPFRDGNTRTTLAFAQNYAREHGFTLDLGILLDNLSRITDSNGKIKRYSIRDKFVLAALDEKDYPEPEHLETLIRQSIQEGIQKQRDKHIEMLEEQEER